MLAQGIWRAAITAARGIFGARAYDRVVWKRGILLMFSWNFLKFAYVLRVVSRFFLQKKRYFRDKKREKAFKSAKNTFFSKPPLRDHLCRYIFNIIDFLLHKYC